MGVCVPSKCGVDDVYNNYRALLADLDAGAAVVGCETDSTQSDIGKLRGRNTIVM
jgi:hypothetical protein